MIPDPQPGRRYQQSAEMGGNVVEVLAVNSGYITVRVPFEPPVRQWVWESWRTYMRGAVLLESEAMNQ